MVKSLQSIRHWLEKTTVGVRAVEHQTRDLAARGAVLHCTGIGIFRAIRSFDPCMPCTVHVANGDNMISQDATTCACGAG